MYSTFAITTSGFDMENPMLAALDDAGWKVVRNPHGRRMTEDEVSELLRTHQVTAMVAGTEPLTSRVFDANPQLRVISRCGSGLDSVDVAAAADRGIDLLRTPEAPAEAVAELTISLAIAALRRVGEADRLMRAGEWKALMGRSLGRSRVGIVGLGHVGRRVAEVATVLGAEVGYTDTFVDNADYQRFPDIVSLAEWTDVLTIHLPRLPETVHIVNEKVLDVLGENAVVVNTARGGLVDEDALCDALSSKRIAGAALDVFEEEPYQGPLIQFPNVILTCHMGSYARQVRAAMEAEALANAFGAIGLPAAG